MVAVDFDDVLAHVGSFGRYQKFLYVLLCVASSPPCAFHYLGQIFMLKTPDHWCRYPVAESRLLQDRYNLTDEDWRRITVPLETTVDGEVRPSRCRMYDVNWTEVMGDWPPPEDYTSNLTTHLLRRRWQRYGTSTDNQTAHGMIPTVACKYGWSYDHSIYTRTVVTDWDLVCGYDWLPDFALSMSVLGNVMGTLACGIIADKFGRRVSFLFCVCILIISGTLTAFMPEFISWTVIRVLVGLTVPASFQIPFVIALELVAPERRTFASMIMMLTFGLGIILLAGVAALFTDWTHLALITSVPMVLLFGIWYVLPESPRWLLSQNRLDDAEKVAQKIAKKNGRIVPPNLLKSIESEKKRLMCSNEQEDGDDVDEPAPAAICDLFTSKTPRLRMRAILLALCWMANNMCYVGMSFIMTRLRINDFIAVLVSGVAEVVSYLIPLFLLERVGRKWPLFISMAIGGVALLLIATLPYEYIGGSFTLVMVGKLGIAMSFAVIYQHAAEIFPTVLRGILLAACSNLGAAVSVVAPYILYLERYGYFYPQLVFGILAIGGALCVIPLPETLYQKLPQTIAEAEQFGKGQNQCFCLTLRKQQNVPSEEMTSNAGVKRKDLEEKLEMADVQANN